MTNQECTCYSRIALLNILQRKQTVTTDALLYEMCYLFDIYSEEAIKKEALLRL